MRKQNHAFAPAPPICATALLQERRIYAAFLFQIILKKGKITLFPFFPYKHTDEGEAARRSITGVPLNAARRGEKPPPVWRANLRANARQVSPFLSTISFVSSKEIVRTKILEKGKTTLLPFSPYSGELHAERVKPPRVYQPRAPKGAAARENRTQSVAKHTRTSGCLSNHGVPQAAACRGTRELILSKKEKSHFSLFSLISLTKPKQRGSDRKRISHHICGVKALGDMSVYYLRALPCIAAIYPLAIASHPERAHFAMNWGDRRSSNTHRGIAMSPQGAQKTPFRAGPFCFDLVWMEVNAARF